MIPFRLAFKVAYVDGRTATVQISTPTTMFWERHFDTSLSDVRDFRMEHMLWMVWKQLFLRTKTPPEFDDWVLDVDWVEPDLDGDDDEDADGDPTTPGTPAEEPTDSQP